MTCKEAMTALLKRKNEGIHYHGTIIDYYKFLHIEGLAEMQVKQMIEEITEYVQWKCHFLKEFRTLPNYIMEHKSIIPTSWKGKTSDMVTHEELKTLIESSLKSWLKWEEETLAIYKECCETLKESENYHCLKLVKNAVHCVQNEISDIKDLIIDGQAHGFDPSYFTHI